MGKYRTHNCNELRLNDAGIRVSLAGWINRKRDHGNVLFIDLRDHYGVTQCVIEKTNTWLAKVPTSIKAVDVVMNDGIQKMAEATAGKPFQIGVFVNKKSEYTMAKPGIIDVHIKSTGRDGRKTKLGTHQQTERFRIESTGKVFFDESNLPQQEFDILDIHLKLDASQCVQRDVISFTVVISEMKDGNEYDRRGMSTIIHIV